MATPITRQFIEDFYRARISCDPERIALFLDDDVEWCIAGPVELMHFCGERRGKQAVIDALVRHVPAQLEVVGMEPEEVLVDGERAAALCLLTAKHARTGRTISYRCAQFLHFRDGRIARFRVLIDSFDAAEQMLGHTIDVSTGDEPAGEAIGNRIAV